MNKITLKIKLEEILGINVTDKQVEELKWFLSKEIGRSMWVDEKTGVIKEVRLFLSSEPEFLRKEMETHYNCKVDFIELYKDHMIFLIGKNIYQVIDQEGRVFDVDLEYSRLTRTRVDDSDSTVEMAWYIVDFLTGDKSRDKRSPSNIEK